MSHEENLENLHHIAIIGMTGRFPGASTVERFWDNLCQGVESISRFSEQELLDAGVDPALLQHPNYVKAGAILEDIEQFDGSFFGFYPKEAEIMNPQHRLFLECAWEVLEKVGCVPEHYPGRIGVYAGEISNGYVTANYRPTADTPPLDRFQLMLGNQNDFLATQVAYKLNLTGPSVSVQTACSTSLAAVHLACQSLLNRECEMALAGGVAIHTPHKEGYLYVEGGINSPDGHCRAFDANAQGTIGGNGVGVIALKLLSDALADGDTILAVIRGTAMNNDGAMKVGFTAPSLEGQADVIADALAMAEVPAETVTYIETHGTGTALGDPIEIGALTHAFRNFTDQTGFCKIGAVKTNVGHLDAAAGVAGLIKTVLALQHRLIPPTLHFEQPNPKIDFANSPFTVNTTLAKWETDGHPRRAGVSSFGIGGTNVHTIMEEAPVLPASGPSRSRQLLLLSARTPEALSTAAYNLVDHLRQTPDLNLADVAYTLQVGRKRFGHCRFLVCQTLDEAVTVLHQPPSDAVSAVAQETESRAVVFMFSGQGAQYPEMGRELYEHEAMFRDTVDHCAALLHPHLGLDIRELIYPDGTRREAAAQQLAQTAFTQPALFVIEYALSQLWRHWGIEPQAMIGHSIGEFVAACLAGVFSLEDALALVATRGRLMQAQPAGAMLALPLSAADCQPYLDDQLALAAINGSTQCVISGPTEAVTRLEVRLEEQGITGQRLSTSHAFHSEMMTAALEPFTAAVASVSLNPPQIPYLSNLTGTWITASEATAPAYWANQLRQTVRFAAGLDALVSHPEWILLEVGPGTTLRSLARQHAVRDAEQTVLASLPHVRDPRSAMQSMLETLGQLWCEGVRVDWPGFYAGEQRQRVVLPTYPFERQAYWLDAQPAPAANVAYNHKQAVSDWFYVPTWKRAPSLSLSPQIDLTRQTLCWLVFVDDCGLGPQLARQLQQGGQTVITVTAGEAFHQQDTLTYTLNPSREADYQDLFNALRTAETLPDRIVHLWGVTPASPGPWATTDTIQNHGFYSLLSIARGLGEHNRTEPLHISVISNQLQAITGDESLLAEKATLLGPCRVIPQEYPHITCRSVDIVLPQQTHDAAHGLVEQLMTELISETPEVIVAYRGQHRWVQIFESVRFNSERATALRPGGVYLITAGLSDTGLTLAHHLAQTVQAKLILLDATPFPDPSDWSTWRSQHRDQEETSHKIDQLRTMADLGAELLVMQADVTELAEMQSALKQAEQRFGPLHGVFHLTSTRGSGLIQLKTAEQAQQVLAPSVIGTRVLNALLRDQRLDFLALFGSVVSVTGGLGQVDECAANAFLDAYTYSHDLPQPCHVVTIDWPGWQWDDYFEQSMASFPQVQAALKAQRERYGITPEELGQATAQLLASDLSHVMVSTQNLDLVIELQTGQTTTNLVAQLDTAGSAQPRSEGTYVAPANEIEAKIAKVWAEEFGIEQVGRDDNFFDLGGHSLMAIQVISRTREVLEIEDLPLSSLYSHPTVAALAELHMTTLHEDIEADELEELLQEIEGLSEEELRSALLEDPED
ncbi:MAG: hypothetical protein ETSY1_00050 [Candidatus Entotheonella factor]|uniref:Uncharacterized protein n=1 Tax=Entotheonella factor TaxID=1429438 RepID=W4LZV7_ENTF1|nr:MAG: hypothetical protein ETSY1_00050 [Candidatus Entotheonella factor]